MITKETYLDNNGIERDSITCKIIIKKHYTKADNERANEIYNTFRTSRPANNVANHDYLNYVESKCINDTE